MLAGAQEVGPGSPEDGRLFVLWQEDWDRTCARPAHPGLGCLRVVSDPTSYLILTLQTLWGLFFFLFFWDTILNVQEDWTNNTFYFETLTSINMLHHS